MPTRQVDVAIIGAGSAGLSALRQVREQTGNYLLIDPGPLGTTCARIGCMPSKVLISTAKDYHRRHVMAETGIRGTGGLSCHLPAVLEHVRKLRDRFAGAMVETTEKLAGDKLLRERAVFTGPQTLQAGSWTIEAERIVIGVGARPVVPGPWRTFGDRILTSENFFEQTDLPSRIAVIGLGPIGLELGQALARLGLEVSGFDMQETIGGLSDPDVKQRAIASIRKDFPVTLGAAAELEEVENGLRVSAGGSEVMVDKVIAAMGVRPNVDRLDLEKAGIELDDRGLPPFNPRTMQIGDLPIFIGGDANRCRPILHEALDEGFIAGRSAVDGEPPCHCRRTSLKMVFSEPEIAVVGQSYDGLKDVDFVVGVCDFEEQARAILEARNEGLLHVYVEKGSGRLLGAEMAIPCAEHLAHMLAAMIGKGCSVYDALQMPFYHPTIEEGLRTALRDAAGRLGETRPPELSLCGSCPEEPLC
jgi:dihydrolipoamide dehydrogenase